MRKAAKIVLVLSTFFALATSVHGFFPDIFTPMIEGQEAARRANNRDRQQAINANIALFNQTGDYIHLCNAAYLRSVEAVSVLRQNQITCCFLDQSGKKVCGKF